MSACRTDDRCQYAIDVGMEGEAACPPGKCVMPRPTYTEEEIADACMFAEIPDSKLESVLIALAAARGKR